MDIPTTPAPQARSYRMAARAVSTQATADRVLGVALELFTDHPYEDVSLADVANRAGVTQRTVIRRFGTKEALFFGANERAGRTEMRGRHEIAVGDIAGAVAAVVASYERFGANRLRVLAQEDRLPIIAEDAATGRRMHHRWVKRTFAPLIDAGPPAERRRRVAALIALTDVYTWKLLRRDAGLSESNTRKVLVQLVSSVGGKING